MAYQDPDRIIKAVRVVPEFDGNANVLPRFINICDHLVAQYISTEPGSELSNLSLINSILNKITGPAARFINSYGISENWAGIRAALINNFSDQRDETALYNDLALATQGNSTPQEYYEKCQTLFSTIMTFVMLHEPVPTTVEAKRTLYKKLTMQAYVRGLKEPLGSRIRCMRPETIEKALEFVQEELNAAYMQSRNESINDRKHAHKPSPPAPVTFSPPAPKATFNFPPNIFMPSLPKPAQQQQPQPWRQPQLAQSHQNQPTRTQQMFRAFPPNYNPQSNVFRLPPRNPNQHPKPMSGVVNFVPKHLPPTNFNVGRFPQQPNRFPREMNVHESNSYGYDYDYPEYYDQDTYDLYPTQYAEYSGTDNDMNPAIYYDLPDDDPSTSELPSASDKESNFRITHNLKKPK